MDRVVDEGGVDDGVRYPGFNEINPSIGWRGGKATYMGWARPRRHEVSARVAGDRRQFSGGPCCGCRAVAGDVNRGRSPTFQIGASWTLRILATGGPL